MKTMVNVLKFRNLLSFCSHKKILVFRAGILCCLPRPFGHATNVRNLRVFSRQDPYDFMSIQ